MQPLHCILRHHEPNPHVSRHMATRRDNNHAAIPLRSARAASKTPYKYTHTHTQTHPKQLQPTITVQCGNKKHERPAPASHTGCPSSPAAATLPEKTQGFVPQLPPQHKSHVTFMQLLQCILQHHFPQSTTSLRHHFPQPPPFVITTSPLPFVITTSPLPFVITTSPPFVMFCDVLLCDVLFCDVLFCDVLLCTAESHNSIRP